MKKIYVVGFPKSGTTWLIRLIADALSAVIGGQDQNEETHEFNERIYKRNQKPTYMVIKSHALPDDFFETKDDSVHAVVYIKRDFRDVIVSSFFHTHRSISAEYAQVRDIKRMFAVNPINTIKHVFARLLLWRKLFFLVGRGWAGTMKWHTHITQWQFVREKHKMKHMSFVAYEDVVRNTSEILEKVIHEIGLESQVSLNEVIQRQSFRAKKEYFKRKYKETNDPKYMHLYKFLRKGEPGDWKNYFSGSMTNYFLRRYKKYMIESGYNV